MVELLLNMGADINCVDTYSGIKNLDDKSTIKPQNC